VSSTKLIDRIEKSVLDYQLNNTFSAAIHEHNVPLSKLAAVLLLLVETNGEPEIVFILRATNPKDPHSGQVAFPGGRVEENDTNLSATALRETLEEIGVRVKNSQILGMLSSRISRKGYTVVPFVARIDLPKKLSLQRLEVAEVFTIPVKWLLDESKQDSAEALGLPAGSTAVYKEYEGKRLWGLTAQIINELKTVIK